MLINAGNLIWENSNFYAECYVELSEVRTLLNLTIIRE